MSSVYVGTTELLTKALDEKGVKTAEGPASSFMGVPVRTDKRIPDGVWLMVPHGAPVWGPRTQVGAISPEYRDRAQSVAAVIAALARTTETEKE